MEKSYGEHKYLLGFTVKSMEAHTKYVQHQYETFRNLFSTRSLIGSRKQIFRNNHLMNSEHVTDVPRRTHRL